MSTVSTTSILGSDSISGSRTTINSNFLLLQNWINAYATTFNIDSVNGILDLSQASTGRVSAKTGRFDEIRIPSAGATGAFILSSGQASFLGVNTTSLTTSGTATFTGIFSSSGASTFSGNLNLNGTSNLNGAFVIGGNSTSPSPSSGSFISNNILTVTGITAGTPFPDSATGSGGGFATTSSSPYVITGNEDVIYAQCGGTGFYLSVGTSGASPSNIPAGFRVRIVNTQTSAGVINTGVIGGNYTGFNTNSSYGNFPSTGITVDAGKPYQSSIHLQWEPRIAAGTGNEEGSWIVLSATNMTW
jgi:hypothetical protein